MHGFEVCMNALEVRMYTCQMDGDASGVRMDITEEHVNTQAQLF